MVRYLSPIDPHVHFRGSEYSVDYLGYGVRDAFFVGLAAFFEQPNPTPRLTDIAAIESRKNIAYAHTKGFIYHGVHIGLTTDLDQVKKALSLVMLNKDGLVSDKTFYVHSTGDMGILDQDLQKEIWRWKGQFGYNGVSVGHFEDESEFSPVVFDPTNPITHSQRQNPKSELVQVQNQIRNASDNNFRGVFYVAHVSNPDIVDYIESERRKLPFDVVLEATFHHMFLNTDDYKLHENGVKMNPPLRTPEMQSALLERVLAGKVQVIGTDHAPHPYELKKGNKPPSGIPALPFWPRGIQLLRKHGIKEQLLEDLVFNNANGIFSLNLVKRVVDIEYDKSLWDVYGYNPFSRLN